MSALHSAQPAPVQPVLSGLYHAAPHAMHWTRAQAVIQERGHFANITLDGLLCVYGTVRADRPSDPVAEHMAVFPVHEGEMVETGPIREWLGLNAERAATA